MVKKLVILSLLFLTANTAPIWASEYYRAFIPSDDKSVASRNLLSLAQHRLAPNHVSYPKIFMCEAKIGQSVFLNYTQQKESDVLVEVSIEQMTELITKIKDGYK